MSWDPKLHSMCLCNSFYVWVLFFFKTDEFFFLDSSNKCFFSGFLFNLFFLWSFVVAFTLVWRKNVKTLLMLLIFFSFLFTLFTLVFWFVAKKIYFMLLLFTDETCAFQGIYTIARKQKDVCMCAAVKTMYGFLWLRYSTRCKYTRNWMTNTHFVVTLY